MIPKQSRALHLAPAPGARDDQAEIAALRREIEGLRHSRETRAPIDQAKGMLMLHYGISADRAFDLLRRWSALHNVKLRVVAETLVQMAVTHHGAAVDSPELLVWRGLRSDIS